MPRNYNIFNTQVKNRRKRFAHLNIEYMKNTILGLSLLLFSASAFAQGATVTDQFKKIDNVQQAQAWMDANKNLKPALLHLSAGKDSTLIDKRLLRQKKGDLFSVGYVTYKVIESTETVKYRANYIFLDGGSLTNSQIDSLRKIILQKATAGESFDKLSDEYTMDGNTQHGALRFIANMMVKEFETAVQEHANGDIFTVDVPNREWYYVVKKTANDQATRMITVLSIFTPH